MGKEMEKVGRLTDRQTEGYEIKIVRHTYIRTVNSRTASGYVVR